MKRKRRGGIGYVLLREDPDFEFRILKGIVMHFYFMLMIMFAFVAAVVYFSKAAVMEFEQRADDDVFRVKGSYLGIIHDKDRLALEKKKLQEEADRIFDLYDLTRDITKTFDESAAFLAFRDHLARRISFTDCRLIERFPDDMDDFSSFKGYQFFPLKTKNTVLGELVYKGIDEKDEDTFAVLAHQFALALRRIRLYKEVEEMAITDGLTRLHTRRHLMERFEEELERAGSRKLALSVLMVDVDHFKRVNDQYGHLAGDQVLRDAAQMIVKSTREVDIVGRYGGEEFFVILPDTDKTSALVVAERIRVAVSQRKIKAYDTVLSVNVSIGVATFKEDALLMDELVDKADWALFRAKKLGRNRVVGFSVYSGDEGA